jgi:hypothetical protein
MALPEDEIKIHRLVVNAIKRHSGAAVLTASTIAKKRKFGGVSVACAGRISSHASQDWCGKHQLACSSSKGELLRNQTMRERC